MTGTSQETTRTCGSNNSGGILFGFGTLKRVFVTKWKTFPKEKHHQTLKILRIGFMEPKSYAFRNVIGHPLLISWEYDDWMPRESLFHRAIRCWCWPPTRGWDKTEGRHQWSDVSQHLNRFDLVSSVVFFGVKQWGIEFLHIKVAWKEFPAH